MAEYEKKNFNIQANKYVKWDLQNVHVDMICFIQPKIIGKTIRFFFVTLTWKEPSNLVLDILLSDYFVAV